MGKTSEGPPEVSFVDENSCTVRKKVAYVLGFLAVASCIVVGLVVYYAGGNMGCQVFNREIQAGVFCNVKNRSSFITSKVCQRISVIPENWRFNSRFV